MNWWMHCRRSRSWFSSNILTMTFTIDCRVTALSFDFQQLNSFYIFVNCRVFCWVVLLRFFPLTRIAKSRLGSQTVAMQLASFGFVLFFSLFVLTNSHWHVQLDLSITLDCLSKTISREKFCRLLFFFIYYIPFIFSLYLLAAVLYLPHNSVTAC